MKKLLALILCVVLCVVFVGCTSDGSLTKETGATNSATEKKEETFGLNDAAVFETLKFTAVEFKETKGASFFVPEDGNTFVGVKFEIQNVSDEEQAVSSLLLFEGYADDVKCEYSFNAACAFSDGTLDGTIAPGKKLVGWYALEVSKNWQTIELNIKSNWLSSSSAKFVFTK